MKFNIKGKIVEDPKLPHEFKKLWVDALRSGKYKKGVGSLENDGKYCCLGVACRIVHPNMILDGGVIGEGLEKTAKKVPNILKDATFSKNELTGKLINLNDSKRWSFNKIADWIDKNL